jgi:hypothetical protein
MKIKQKLLILCILSCEFYLSSAANILFSQASYAQDAECQSAIANSVKRIENAKATIVKFDKYDQSSLGYKDYPENRPLGYNVWLSSKGAVDVMSSRAFLTDISTQIISNCQSISSVRFGQYRTDNVVIYGLMKNGKVEPFECISPGPEATRKLRWSKHICI